MSATINTFPPFQSMNSPRGWILAVIVLLHFGFFLLLSSSMGQRIVEVLRPPSVTFEVPTQIDDPVPPPPKPFEVAGGTPIDHPTPPAPIYPTHEDPPTAPETADPAPGGDTVGGGEGPSLVPVVVQPEIDAARGLSEPLYPASEIRGNHTGTVLLSVLVLENGRVGEVRLDQSSGRPKLDESAMREARRWRLKPGMRDGIAVPMWKQIPITFQLQTGDSRR